MASWPNNVYSLYTDKINSHVKVSPCSHRPAAYRPMCCVNDHGRLYVYAFCGIKNKNRFRIPLVEREPAAPPNYPHPPRPLGLAPPCLFTFTSLCKRFFQRIIKDKSNVLFYLLPAKRDVQLTTRLRCSRQYPTIYARTNRYKNSFILFGLNHFQRCDFVYA